jgi:peroxiredoxin
MTVETPLCNFGWQALDFDLLGTDGKRYNLANTRGHNGLLVMFICNHCPYVKAVRKRIVRDTLELRQYDINAVAIMSNDAAEYPEDNFENMRKVALEYDFPFPYLWDEDQKIAQAYGAVCTPDFFGFNKQLELQYRGRLDASRILPLPRAPRDLFNAMIEIAHTGHGPRTQLASMGCSIKWKS